MLEFLLIDLDDTILDFQKAEHIALRNTLRAFGVEPTDETCELYSRINRACWEALERGEMTRPQVAVGRFAELFASVPRQNCMLSRYWFRVLCCLIFRRKNHQNLSGKTRNHF